MAGALHSLVGSQSLISSHLLVPIRKVTIGYEWWFLVVFTAVKCITIWTLTFGGSIVIYTLSTSTNKILANVTTEKTNFKKFAQSIRLHTVVHIEFLLIHDQNHIYKHLKQQ